MVFFFYCFPSEALKSQTARGRNGLLTGRAVINRSINSQRRKRREEESRQSRAENLRRQGGRAKTPNQEKSSMRQLCAIYGYNLECSRPGRRAGHDRFSYGRNALLGCWFCCAASSSPFHPPPPPLHSPPPPPHGSASPFFVAHK